MVLVLVLVQVEVVSPIGDRGASLLSGGGEKALEAIPPLPSLPPFQKRKNNGGWRRRLCESL